jgi:hypothetical protein
MSLVGIVLSSTRLKIESIESSHISVRQTKKISQQSINQDDDDDAQQYFEQQQ